MNKINGMLLFILSVALATVDGWGACSVRVSEVFYNLGKCTTFSSGYCVQQYGPVKCKDLCYSGGTWSGKPCGNDIFVRIEPYGSNQSSWCSDNTECGTSNLQLVPNVLCCTDQCAADSVRCVNDGNIWQEDPSASCGKSCKINHCKAADSTWLSTSIAACTGSNNYALVNTADACLHVGICCSNDSTITGDHCTWRCDSLYTECTNRTGRFVSAVLPDTAVSGSDTTFSYKCYYNCSNAYSPDSLTSVTAGNIALTGPGDSVSTGTKVPNDFNSIRTETGGIYIYDFLTPAASDYVDSLTSIRCANHLWRCVKNGKYAYWYDNQDVPDSCTNIVRVK